MKYPNVLSEPVTIERVAAGSSLARFGDGELRIAIGGAAISQVADPKLRGELRAILSDPAACPAGIPNPRVGPNVDVWAKYSDARFTSLYKRAEYLSAFITRPDSAPWIDTPAYWQSVSNLWNGKSAVLVVGDEKSLTPAQMIGATHVRVVKAPVKNAYASIDKIEEEIGTPAGPVFMCLGATATALAGRLDRKGCHAVDLGHIGMFMRHAGAYRNTVDDLSSPEYRDQIRTLHATTKWGHHGASHLDEILRYAKKLGATSIVDYGAGRRTLKPAIGDRMKVFEYDPGVPEISRLPKPADMVVSTDVLEHIEPSKLDAVLLHQYTLAKRGSYHVISCRPAGAILPDGRNAHLIVKPPEWWKAKLQGVGWKIEQTDVRKGFHVWARK